MLAVKMYVVTAVGTGTLIVLVFSAALDVYFAAVGFRIFVVKLFRYRDHFSLQMANFND